MKKYWAVLLPLAVVAVIAALCAVPVPALAGDGDNLTTSLVSCWELDEASGTREDAYGDDDLSDINTVGQAAGRVDYAASFVDGNNERLSHADNANLSMGDIDFAISFWVYLDDTGDQAFLSKQSNDNADKEYFLGYVNGSGFRFSVSADGSSYANVYDNFSASASTWYLVTAWHDATGNTINIQVNERTPVSTSHSSGVDDGAQSLRVGMRWNDYLDGRIDVLSIWKRTLTSDERTWLYNSGSGRSCDDFINIATPTPTVTNTPLPSSTPTPSGEYIGSLASGDWYTISRGADYGQVVQIGVSVITLIVVTIIGGALLLTRWLNR